MDLAARILAQKPAAGGAWPEWLLATRARHAEQLLRSGLPDRTVEEWKYTSLISLEKKELRLSAPAGEVPSAEQLGEFALPGVRAHRLVFVNGHFSESLSTLHPLPDGLVLTHLSRATAADLEAARRMLGADFGAPEAAFAALNTAAAGAGLMLRVDAGCRLEAPVECLYLSVPGEQDMACHLRNVVLLGEGARCALIERHGAIGTPAHLTNVVNQFDLAAGAGLEHLRIQTDGDAATLITRGDVHLQQDARYRYHGFDLGGRLVRHDLNARLNGPGADCSLNGVYALDGRRHVDNHLRVDHLAPNATSSEFFKGVVDGRSRAVFSGKVVVHKGADGTDARQTNRNLVLSPHAEVDTKPELEIYADDVKCAHGATVGQLDESQLFYMQSRGLPENEARALLTYAFCREVVDRVEPESLRDYIAALVVAHLPRPEALENLG